MQPLAFLWTVTIITAMALANVEGNHRRHIRVPETKNISDEFQSLSFREGFSVVWGAPKNIRQLDDGTVVKLTLDNSSGAGFISQDDYYYGFFSAAIKLPPRYSAGVVVAFYTSNADVYPRTHDELDFEFLGHTTHKTWILQTNLYGNGSVHRGREERFHLWFDPSADFHQYAILWNANHTVFFVDNIPIREVLREEAMGAEYPSKAMSVYGTIWDGSPWATEGGKYPVDYHFSPFSAYFGDLKLDGCVWNPAQASPLCFPRPRSSLRSEFTVLDSQQRVAMSWARNNFMTYSYCHDSSRFPTAPPECSGREQRFSRLNAEESPMFQFFRFQRPTSIVGHIQDLS